MKPFKSRLFPATLAIALVVTTASAQTTVPFGSVNYDPKQQIEIVSDSFTLSQNNGKAEFVGNVVAGQGGMRLAADKIVVEYEPAKDKEERKINRMIATGGVTLVAGDQSAEADRAIYFVKDQKIVMEGKVLISQAQNALSGQKATIDLASGTAKIIGRVKTIFGGGGN